MVKQLNPISMTEPAAEEWIVESDAELDEIPDSAPFGSIALVLTDNGLTVKMKNSQGEWKDVAGGESV